MFNNLIFIYRDAEWCRSSPKKLEDLGAPCLHQCKERQTQRAMLKSVGPSEWGMIIHLSCSCKDTEVWCEGLDLLSMSENTVNDIRVPVSPAQAVQNRTIWFTIQIKAFWSRYLFGCRLFSLHVGILPMSIPVSSDEIFSCSNPDRDDEAVSWRSQGM